MRDERVLITGARAPVALHLARLLHGAGCYVVIADSLSQAIGFATKACDAAVLLPPATTQPARYHDAIRAIIAAHSITHVAPTCEEVFHLAHLWAQDAPEATLMAPDLDLLAQVHSKAGFIELARSFDLPVPETMVLTSGEDLEALPGSTADLVFKPVWSRFGTDVVICPDRVSFVPTPKVPWVAQTFLEGALCSAYAVARSGAVTALSAYAPEYRAGQGAGTAFRPLRDDRVAAFVEAFVRGTAWTGQISFDFITTPESLHAIECNPRATSGLHFFGDPDVFASAFFGGSAATPDVEGLQGVPLAMAVYGVWPALRAGRFGAYASDLRQVTNVLAWPGDAGPKHQQWRALAEIARIALRRRVSLQRAATDDIEWNGPPGAEA